jgi:hypothetical protein
VGVPPGKRPVLKAPETAAGYRTIDVPANIAAALRAHLGSFVGPGPTAWVFGTTKGKPIESRNFFRQWEKARKQVGRTDPEDVVAYEAPGPSQAARRSRCMGRRTGVCPSPGSGG